MKEKNKFIISEAQAITYKLRRVDGGSLGWAEITLREWENGGSFYCGSDYESFSNTWTSIGNRSFKEFLCGLSKDYFLKKTRPADYLQFSLRLTCQAIKAEILELRKQGWIGKRGARICWEECERIAKEHHSNADSFFQSLETSDLIEKIYDYDYSSVPVQQEYNPQCDAFWEDVWPHFVEYWKKQL